MALNNPPKVTTLKGDDNPPTILFSGAMLNFKGANDDDNDDHDDEDICQPWYSTNRIPGQPTPDGLYH